MKTRTFLLAAAGVGTAVLVGLSPAEAKRAHCYTEEQYYDCNFKGLDDSGSFTIWERGHPTFTLWMDRPGAAYGYADYGTGNVSLPGMYIRSNDDAACWDNSDTDSQICAW